MSGTSKPKRIPRAVREQQMLDAAVQVFAQSGYHGASMDEVAEAAGVSKPMVYLYLSSKEDLFVECIRREARKLLEAVTAAVSQATTVDEMMSFGMEAFFNYVVDHSDSWRVLYYQARSLGPPFSIEVDKARRGIIAGVAGLIDSQHEGETIGREAQAMSYALVGAADALAEWAATDGDSDARASTQRLMNLVWLGLERRFGGERWPPPPAG
jgi:AcrR family transcriptional regulator